MSKLANSPLVPCKRGTPALDKAVCAELLRELPAWSVVQESGVAQLHCSFTFNNFVEALRFANTVGLLAEAANHHPALLIEWGKVEVQWWTHTIKGLHHNDFVMAARTDAAFSEAT
jgi:4a-hydroxytetrahydrobiopterin dehydratase